MPLFKATAQGDVEMSLEEEAEVRAFWAAEEAAAQVEQTAPKTESEVVFDRLLTLGILTPEQLEAVKS